MTDIWFMRHAKSAYPPGVPDHDRPLNERGRRNALVAGAWLRAQGIETALVSSAVRAQETWDIVAAHLDICARTVSDLYDADVPTIAAVIDELAQGRTLIIAHNPGLVDFVVSHGEPGVDLTPWRTLGEKFPTSAIARLRDGVLVDFVIPR
jgi:phosphohistidine phosphatase